MRSILIWRQPVEQVERVPRHDRSVVAPGSLRKKLVQGLAYVAGDVERVQVGLIGGDEEVGPLLSGVQRGELQPALVEHLSSGGWRQG